MVTKADMKPTQIGQRGPVLQTSRAPYWEYDKFGQLQLLSIPNLDALIYLANLNLLCHTLMSFPRKSWSSVVCQDDFQDVKSRFCVYSLSVWKSNNESVDKTVWCLLNSN